MRISPDILFGLLSEEYRLNRFGRGIKTRELSLPTLYEPGTKPTTGGVYVARSSDLPNRPPETCIFICCGTKPPNVWNSWHCDVIHIVDPRASLVGVLNSTLAIFDKLVTWEDRMQRLAITGAHVREMVEASIPIFENSITVSDYELQILAHCEPNDALPGRPVMMTEGNERVPPAYISATKGFGLTLTQKREPYLIEEIENPDAGIEGVSSYCINLYQGNTYVGTCALKEEFRPRRSHDYELFQLFAEYIHDCLGVQSQGGGNQLITVRTVFEQVLQGYPVSMRDMNQVLDLIEPSLGGRTVGECKWCCTVIQNVHRDKGLPERYLCKTVEDVLPSTSALVYDGSIVAFSLIGKSEHRMDAICEPLQDYLVDMGFKAGVSRSFNDPFHARTHYQQAMSALDMGLELEPARDWYLFGDHVLDYMLQNCCGDFDAEAIVAPELMRLYNSGQSGPEYVETLRVFLDNECHTTQTATQMYLHRSTLIKRLDRIREIVDLETSERRLYLRMCLHLPGIDTIFSENGVSGDFD